MWWIVGTIGFILFLIGFTPIARHMHDKTNTIPLDFGKHCWVIFVLGIGFILLSLAIYHIPF